MCLEIEASIRSFKLFTYKIIYSYESVFHVQFAITISKLRQFRSDR